MPDPFSTILFRGLGTDEEGRTVVQPGQALDLVAHPEDENGIYRMLVAHLETDNRVMLTDFTIQGSSNLMKPGSFIFDSGLVELEAHLVLMFPNSARVRASLPANAQPARFRLKLELSREGTRDATPPRHDTPHPQPQKLSEAQIRHLEGVPDRVRNYLLLYGAQDHDLPHGIFGLCQMRGWWTELDWTQRSVTMRIWKVTCRTTLMELNGKIEEVHVHPSMDGQGRARPEGPPDYDHTETFVLDGWGGTRLAAHASLWLVAESRREQQNGQDDA